MTQKIQYIKNKNNIFQNFEVLKNNRTKRYRYKEFFVEGVRNINEAILNSWEISSLIFSKDKELSDWATNIINSKIAKNLYALEDSLAQDLSGKDDTSELMAIVKIKERSLSDFSTTTTPLIVVFDRPSNKGNLGTIIRSLDGFCADALITTGHSVDLYDPDVITSTMGSFFKVPTYQVAGAKEISDFASKLKASYPNLQIVGSSAHSDKCIDKVDFSLPTILLIGNETYGLSSNYKELADTMMTIPMGGSASSFNVACATSIMLYEISRQRNFPVK